MVIDYTPLGYLKHDVAAEPIPHTELADKVKVLSLSRDYATDIITLFHATGDFNYRPRWQEGVKKVEEVDHLLPRVGMRCRCVLDNGEAITYANSYRYQSDRIEFTETDEQRQSVMRFILEAVDPHTTRLTLEYHLAKRLPGQVLFRLTRKEKLERVLERSLQHLDALVKEIRIPGTGAAP